MGEAAKYDLVQCVYDPAEKAKLVNEFFSKYIAHFLAEYPNLPVEYLESVANEHYRTGPQPFLSGLVREFLEDVQSLSPQLKHEAFSAENEWRLVSTLESDHMPGSFYRTPQRVSQTLPQYQCSPWMLVPVRVFNAR